MKFLHFVSIIDHVKWLFSCKGGAKAGQKAGFRVMLKYFEIKKAFRYYIKQIDSMLPCIWFSNRSQKTSKCGKNISDTLGYATYLFLPHFDVICDLLMNRRTATWNLFVKYKLSIQSGIDPLADNCNSSYCGCTVLSKPSFFINQHVGVLHVYSGNRTQT